MHIYHNLKKLHNYLFLILVLTVPFNLGKHFYYPGAYIEGLLVDYLIPTLYVQDILIILVFVFWGIAGFRLAVDASQSFFRTPSLWVLLAFVFFTYISLFFSGNTISSTHFFIRLIGYLFLVLYVVYGLNTSEIFFAKGILKSKFVLFLLFLIPPLLFVELLSLAQWFMQSSVFNNYLFFGEQPYTSHSFGIVRRSFLERTVVPPYGTFRHPNVLGGFLSITLLWFYHFILKHFSTSKKLSIAFLLTLALGSTILLLTFSKVAFISFLTGTTIITLYTLRKSLGFKFLGLFAGLTLALAIALPFITTFYAADDPSFYRRVILQDLAFESIQENPLFGIGPGNASYVSSKFTFTFPDFKFPQPVHNVFILIFVESGVFAFASFVVLFIYLFYKAPFIFKVTLSQFLLLMLFDHYVFTAHQTLLLFCLTIGFCLDYNFSARIKNTYE